MIGKRASKVSRSRTGASEKDVLFVRELVDLPLALRWCEWMLRVEAACSLRWSRSSSKRWRALSERIAASTCCSMISKPSCMTGHAKSLPSPAAGSTEAIRLTIRDPGVTGADAGRGGDVERDHRQQVRPGKTAGVT